MIIPIRPRKKRSQNEACGPNSSLTDASTHLLGRLGCRADAGHCVWIPFTFTARGASGRGSDVVLPKRKARRRILVLYKTTTTRCKIDQTPLRPSVLLAYLLPVLLYHTNALVLHHARLAPPSMSNIPRITRRRQTRGGGGAGGRHCEQEREGPTVLK